MHSYREGLWLICLMLILTGCWDRVEIEERGFVLGAAIDTADEKRWKLTYQFVVPSALSAKGGSGGKKSPGAFLNVTSEGNTLFKVTRDMSTTVSRSPYLQHIKLILFSEKVAKKGDVGRAMDLFIRDHEMRRASKVMIVDGEAQKILESNPGDEKMPVMNIDSIAQNPYKSSGIMPSTNVAKVHGYLLGRSSFAIPRIVEEKNKVKIAGAAVFKGFDNRMVGFLNEDETAGLNFLTGRIKGGSLEFKIKDEFLVFELKGTKHSLRADITDAEHPVFNMNVFAEGNIGETYASLDFLKPEVIAEVERRVAEKIEGLTASTLEKLQGDYKTDVVGLGSFLKEEHYRDWKKIKDNWDTGKNYFSKSRIRVHVKVKMRIIGSVIESEKQGVH